MIPEATASVAAWLATAGLKDGDDFVPRVVEDAEQNEAAWRARLVVKR